MNDRDIVPLVVGKAGQRRTADNTHDSEWKAFPPIVIDNQDTGKARICKNMCLRNQTRNGTIILLRTNIFFTPETNNCLTQLLITRYTRGKLSGL